MRCLHGQSSMDLQSVDLSLNILNGIPMVLKVGFLDTCFVCLWPLCKISRMCLDCNSCVSSHDERQGLMLPMPTWVQVTIQKIHNYTTVINPLLPTMVTWRTLRFLQWEYDHPRTSYGLFVQHNITVWILGHLRQYSLIYLIAISRTDCLYFIHIQINQLWYNGLVTNCNCLIWYFILNNPLWFIYLLNTIEQTLWKLSIDCSSIYPRPIRHNLIYSTQWW